MTLKRIMDSQALREWNSLSVAIAKNFGARITLLHVEEAKLSGLKPEIVKKVGEEILIEAESRIEGVGFDRSLKPRSPIEIMFKMACSVTLIWLLWAVED